MLRRARESSSACLVQATAERLPFAAGTFDRVLCVNALHHFHDPTSFVVESGRILRRGGALLIVGLDPHAGADSWWIYDYFPTVLEADRLRYPSTARIRDMLVEAGFVAPRTEIVQHLPGERTYERALAEGVLDRHSTSQLMVISDEEFDAGMRRLAREQPVLRSDLRLFGTFAEMR
jgi:ubiquinone/menaquinone biosynthesis C-methylase UbiE